MVPTHPQVALSLSPPVLTSLILPSSERGAGSQVAPLALSILVGSARRVGRCWGWIACRDVTPALKAINALASHKRGSVCYSREPSHLPLPIRRAPHQSRSPPPLATAPLPGTPRSPHSVLGATACSIIRKVQHYPKTYLSVHKPRPTVALTASSYAQVPSALSDTLPDFPPPESVKVVIWNR